jgi:hypothetical protein
MYMDSYGSFCVYILYTSLALAPVDCDRAPCNKLLIFFILFYFFKKKEQSQTEGGQGMPSQVKQGSP